MNRVLIAFDGDMWFVRSIKVVEHDVVRDEIVYYCDAHIGGPFKTCDQAAKCAKKAARRKP